MALEQLRRINAYAGACVVLRQKWDRFSNAKIWSDLIAAIRGQVLDIFPVPTFVQGHYGQRVFGLFDHKAWKITLNYDACGFTLPLDAFLEWVTTPYHECRHAEQVYQIAMGVLCGEIEIAGKGRNQQIQAMAGRSFREIRNVWQNLSQGQRPFEANQTIRRQTVSKWLKLKLDIICHADTHRHLFSGFNTMEKKQVREWTKTYYQGETLQMSEFIQQQVKAAPGHLPSGLRNFYKGLAEEKDAHQIQDRVKDTIRNHLRRRHIT